MSQSGSKNSSLQDLLQQNEQEIEHYLQEHLDIGRVPSSSPDWDGEIQALVSGRLSPQIFVAGQPRPDNAYHPDFVEAPTGYLENLTDQGDEKTTHLGETPSWYQEHLQQHSPQENTTGRLGSTPSRVYSHTDNTTHNIPSPGIGNPGYGNRFEQDFAALTTRIPSILPHSAQDSVLHQDSSAQSAPNQGGLTAQFHNNPVPPGWIQVEPTVPLLGNENETKQLPDSVFSPTVPLPIPFGEAPTEILTRSRPHTQKPPQAPLPPTTPVPPAPTNAGRSQRFCPNCGHTLVNDSTQAGHGSTTTTPNMCPTCQFPLRIGQNFRVVGELGQGSFGRVLQAEHTSQGKTYVCAIKMLHPNLEHSPALAQCRPQDKPKQLQNIVTRFRREIEFMYQLSQTCHAVPKVYAHGQDSHWGDFVAMEYLSGQTLEDFLSNKIPMSPKEATKLMLALCDAVNQLHEAQIWHRDLKPANIFLQQSEHSGWNLKLMDLGTAKGPHSLPNQAKLTQGMLGTPYYSSPQQILNDPDLDHRTDVYSMGAIFYEMLTGQPPFPGTEVMAVLVAHLREEPVPLHQRCPQLKFPTGLNELVLRALEKYPKERFDSALDFKQALLPFA